jgi:hypothetical protein
MVGREGKLTLIVLVIVVIVIVIVIVVISLDILYYLSIGPNTSV